MLWEKDSGIVNVYKDTIPRFHRAPSKKKKKKNWKWALYLHNPVSLTVVLTDVVEYTRDAGS